MAKTSTSSLFGLHVIEKPELLEVKPVYVVFGDEEFLRSESLVAIRRTVLGADADEFGATRLDGKTAQLADVLDELALLPFFGSRRLVVLIDADGFVSAHRDALERYVQKPHRSGVLVLSVQSWPSNTRLAKMVAQSGSTIDCKSPDDRSLSPWCRRWSMQKYNKTLRSDAAELLVELVAGGPGALDTELAKLAGYVGNRTEITAEDVDKLVAAGRVETVWRILDAAGNGDTATAIGTLRSLLGAGEQPLLIFGALSSQLRKLAKVHRLVSAGEPVRSALPKAGINFYADKAVAQLRHLGSTRLDQLYDWLVELDLGLKGDSELSPHHLLERLIVRVAARADG